MGNRNVTLSIFFIFVLTLTKPLQALSTDIISSRLDVCSKIENSEERLKCYDGILVNTSGDNDKGNWIISRSESKMDGNRAVSYRAESANELLNSIGMPKKAHLVLRCEEKTTDAYIVWPSSLGSFNDVAVAFKIDDGKIIKERWNPASGLGSGAFCKKPIDFIKKLSGAKHIIFKTSPYGRTAEEAEFSIKGIDRAISEISEACEWKKGGGVKKQSR